MTKYKLKKISKSDNAVYEPGQQEDRQHRGWTENKSTPIGMVATGFVALPPDKGSSFMLFGVSIDGLQNHGNVIRTSTVDSVTKTDYGYLFTTMNSIYKLEEIF